MGNKCFIELTELEAERHMEAEVALQSRVMSGLLVTWNIDGLDQKNVEWRTGAVFESK